LCIVWLWLYSKLYQWTFFQHVSASCITANVNN
jgi:hypothetical protein